MGMIALVSSVPKDVIQALIQLLNETDVEVKRSGIRALGEIGPKAADAIPALQQILKDADPNLRRAAAVAISRIEPGGGGGEG
jgi:HEAT repeat protein